MLVFIKFLSDALLEKYLSDFFLSDAFLKFFSRITLFLNLLSEALFFFDLGGLFFSRMPFFLECLFFSNEFPPLFHAVSNPFVLDCNSLVLAIQFPVSLTPEVQNTMQKLLSVSFIYSSDSVP